MRKTFALIFIFSISYSLGALQAQTLKLITIRQLKYNGSFELSGMVATPQGIMAIEDGVPHLFQIDTSTWEVSLVKHFPIPEGQVETDLEGIDYYNHKLVFLDEATSKVHFIENDKWVNIPYELSPEVFKQTYDFKKWGNAGYEGLAFDTISKHLFLVKERMSTDGVDRMVYEIDMNTGKLLRIITTPIQNANTDYADAKVEYINGKAYLYLLERNGYLVTRVDLATLESQSLSYSGIMNDSNLKLTLYTSKNPQFGIAEAIMLTPNAIWIGVDNNHRKVNKKHPMAKKYKLKGKSPSIFIFERPAGF